jgi:hypothetical protein
VTITDDRLRNLVSSVVRLEPAAVELSGGASGPGPIQGDIWLTDAEAYDEAAAERFVEDHLRRRVVVVGHLPDSPANPRIIQLGERPKVSALRAVIRAAFAGTSPADAASSTIEDPRPVRG